MIDKTILREELKSVKEESLKRHENLIRKYAPLISRIQSNIPTRVNPILKFCESKNEINMWCAITHMTTSHPFRLAVGRRIKFMVIDEQTGYIYGMVQLASDLAQLRQREEYIGWDYKVKWGNINKLMNIQLCVPTSPLSNLLTGKMLVYSIFTQEIINYFKENYNDDLIGITTTSLYGRSSMYERLKQLKYLGLTEGLSAIKICDEDWAKIKKEYYEKYPKTKTNRAGEVKFQIVDKLSKWYEKNDIDFPYVYHSDENRRGVYFGYTCANGREILNNEQSIPEYNVPSFKESIQKWKERWFIPRMERLNFPTYQPESYAKFTKHKQRLLNDCL